MEGGSTSSQVQGYTEKRISCCGFSKLDAYKACVDKRRCLTKEALKEDNGVFCFFEPSLENIVSLNIYVSFFC